MEVKINEVSPEGILLIDKEKGKTSFDAVRIVKKILKCKKVGHAGTLDPFATGLLIILLGQGTKLSPYIMGGKKKYRAEIMLGIETDTYDSTGSVVKDESVPEIGIDDINECIARFSGVIEQIPPAFSALKVNGQRAYKLARKGIEVELKKREVVIYSIDIIDVGIPLITLDITCSAGTYIRSLAVDIGKKLGTVAHLKNLRRLSSGLFEVDDAMILNEPDSVNNEDILKRMIPLQESLPGVETLIVDNYFAGKIRNGYRPAWAELTEKINLSGKNNGYIKIMTDSNLVAVAEIENALTRESNRLKKVKVFN